MRIKDLATRATKLLTGNAYMVFDNGTKVEKVDYAELTKQIITEYNTQTLAGSAQSVKSALDTLNSNAPIYKGSVSNSLSNLTTPGFYYYGTTIPSDAPNNRPYGQVIVLGAIAGGVTSHILQIVNTSSYHIYYRRKEGNATDDWSEWREFTIPANEVKTTTHPNITDVLTPAQDVTILHSYVSVRNGLVILDCNFTQTSTNTADRFTFKNGYKPDVLNTNIAPALMYSNNAVSDSVMFINPTTLTIFGATPVANQAYYFRLIYFIQ